MTFDRFEELFLKRKLDVKSSRVYSEWTELVNSYGGYVEDGELDCIVEEVRDLEPSRAALLTPKRIELTYQLAALRVESINDLAKKVRRNAKNAYQDLRILAGFGFVKLKKRKGRSLVPETLVKEIAFLIR